MAPKEEDIHDSLGGDNNPISSLNDEFFKQQEEKGEEPEISNNEKEIKFKKINVQKKHKKEEEEEKEEIKFDKGGNKDSKSKLRDKKVLKPKEEQEDENEIVFSDFAIIEEKEKKEAPEVYKRLVKNIADGLNLMQFHFDMILKKKNKIKGKSEDSPKIGETYGKLEESPNKEKEDLNIDINKEDINGEEEPKDSLKEDNIDLNEIKIEEINDEEENKEDNINENKIEEKPNEEDKIEDDMENIENLPNVEIHELKKVYKAGPPEEKVDIFHPGKEEIPITIIPTENGIYDKNNDNDNIKDNIPEEFYQEEDLKNNIEDLKGKIFEPKKEDEIDNLLDKKEIEMEEQFIEENPEIDEKIIISNMQEMINEKEKEQGIKLKSRKKIIKGKTEERKEKFPKEEIKNESQIEKIIGKMETTSKIEVEFPEKKDEKILLKGKNKKIISHSDGKKEDKKEDKKKEDKNNDSKDKQSSIKEKKIEYDINRVGDADFMTEGINKVQLPHKWRTHPRTYGKDSRYCRVCRNTHGLIRKYGLNICRKCFRERASLIGFKQTK